MTRFSITSPAWSLALSTGLNDRLIASSHRKLAFGDYRRESSDLDVYAAAQSGDPLGGGAPG